MQCEDFEGIFRAMDGLPVTVRLLDPPLHEFLPDSKDLAKEIAEREARGEEAEEQRRQLWVAESLEERNPMLGLRGVRLGLLKPEIYLMQVRAIAKAARTVREEGGNPVVEIMIPLVALAPELRRMRAMLEPELAGSGIPIGTMIELPRACAVADKIATVADFFSFGTNDLTQMVCGISRDDAEEKFLADYLREGILSFNPFQTIDRDGVGEFVKTAIERGRGRTRTSSSASAGSTAATPRASPSSKRSAWTTSRALPSGCQAPASPPPRPSWGSDLQARERTAQRLAAAEPVRDDVRSLTSPPGRKAPGEDATCAWFRCVRSVFRQMAGGGLLAVAVYEDEAYGREHD